MTSTVKSTLKESIDYYQLFKALLPGGSITGAPKYRTMQIIQELESTLRDVYTGAIGFISKEEAIFNIPIRTIVLENGKGTMGVGSGIVWDSNPKKEYEECIVKQRFLFGTIPLQLIESILLRNGKPTLLNLHLKRLKFSAHFFGFSYNEEEIVNAITQYNKDKIDKSSTVKLRLELFRDGKFQLEHSNIQIQRKPLGRIQLSHVRINSNNIFQSHKTTIRKTYNEGETVLDNCIGSGTTAVACQNTGRECIGIEKDKTYFDLATKRLNDIWSEKLNKQVNELF